MFPDICQRRGGSRGGTRRTAAAQAGDIRKGEDGSVAEEGAKPKRVESQSMSYILIALKLSVSKYYLIKVAM